MAGLLAAGGALAASATYTFNYPAISHPTEHTPVAWLTLTDVSGGVEFLFTPNWGALDSGVHFDELDLAYSGSTSTTMIPGGDATFLPSQPWAFDTSNHAGYEADVRFLMVHWDNTHQGDHFDSGTSAWSFTGVSLADFTGTFASGYPNRDITPIYGIVSLQGLPGDSQNWVAAIPEPQTSMLMLAGLGAMAYMARRRTKR